MQWVRAYSMVVCLFTFFVQDAQSIIVESSTINEINNHISSNRKILIVVDLDETIITATTGLGKDSWFYTYLNKLIAHGLAPDYARTLMRSLNTNVQKHTKLRLIEKQTSSLIAHWQAQGLTVIALTARNARIAEHTAEQLHTFDIAFTNHSVEQNFVCPEHACHYKGIICCGPHNKGNVLTQWLDAVCLNPDIIIFIDDKLKNIHDVQHAVQSRNIDFVGIRYSHCDEEIKSFNFASTIAELQKLYDTHPEIERLPVAIAA